MVPQVSPAELLQLRNELIDALRMTEHPWPSIVRHENPVQPAILDRTVAQLTEQIRSAIALHGSPNIPT